MCLKIDTIPKDLMVIYTVSKEVINYMCALLSQSDFFNLLKVGKFFKDCYGLKHLTFGRNFNEPLVADMIPKSVTHLEFGRKFNQPLVDDVLPAGLTHLTFGVDFKQPLVADMIPKRVTHLTFGWKFNQLLVDDVLPAG